MMSPSPRNFPWLLRLLVLISAGCFLAGCATTDQQQRWQVEEADRSVNKDASGELSPALEAANVVGGFLNSGAGFHGSF
jgi:hypothetical protein